MQKIINKLTGGNSLPEHKLGKHGPKITAMGYGAMGLSFGYGPPKPDEERFAVLDKCYQEGLLFWDSADMYLDNEDLLGAWFKRNPGKREHIFLATKFANRQLDNGSYEINTTPEYCRAACEKSLSRLGVPFIDLYYAHRLDGKTPVEQTVREMKKLQDEGKIKHLGLSECSAASLRRACKVAHIDAVQIEYSPFSLDIESAQIGLLAACRELGVAVVAYSPIGRGMLSGKYRSPDDFAEGDFRKFAPRFSAENFPKNLQLVDQITAVAQRKGVTPSQITLAWLMAQGDDIFPIPGTTNLERLDENLGAFNVKLTKEEEQEIRKASENAEVVGERYPSMMVKALFADTPEE
jgi:aryl-alcohol dehydrogenase-like predicted oxidoreductase